MKLYLIDCEDIETVLGILPSGTYLLSEEDNIIIMKKSDYDDFAEDIADYCVDVAETEVTFQM